MDYIDYIIYHKISTQTDCPDGLAAAWVASKKYPDATILGCVYQSEPPVFVAGDKVLIVDFSFKKPVIQRWLETGVKVQIVDHHISAWNDLGSLENLIFDIKESGATLTWKTLFPDQEMPHFLNYVRARDVEIWSLPVDEFYSSEANAFHKISGLIGRNFSLYNLVAPLSKDELDANYLELGLELLREDRAIVGKICDRAVRSGIGGFQDIPTVFVNDSEARYSSEIGLILCYRYPDSWVAIAQESDTQIRYQLRSNTNLGNQNVSEIAVANGGGGHWNAAGFTKFK